MSKCQVRKQKSMESRFDKRLKGILGGLKPDCITLEEAFNSIDIEVDEKLKANDKKWRARIEEAKRVINAYKADMRVIMIDGSKGKEMTAVPTNTTNEALDNLLKEKE